MNWTEKHIRDLKKAGKIRGANIYKRKNYSCDRVQAVPRETPKGITWLSWNLMYWCNQRAVSLELEYRFCDDRNWRSDFAIPAYKILIEYEGGIFMKRGGHNSPAGIQRDIEKYGRAQQLGYKVIRLHAMNYTTVLKTLNEILK